MPSFYYSAAFDVASRKGPQVLPSVRLGPTDLTFRPIGVGTWQWGNGRYWKFDPKRGPQQAKAAFHASLDAGITFFDTAEIYGGGMSEKLLGALMHVSGRRPFVATKFAPLPYRLSSATMTRALEHSLARLRIERVDLYQVHWPWSLLKMGSLVERLADAVDQGQVRYVGVSNFSAVQMVDAHRRLAEYGIPLVSNQVHYSLLRREAETNGVLETCRALDITLIAYSPLEQGALSGTHRPGTRRPAGLRRFKRAFRHPSRVLPVINELESVAARYGRTPSQVALNWLARQGGVLPIPGARDGRHAADNARAVDFEITDEEAHRLGETANRAAKLL